MIGGERTRTEKEKMLAGELYDASAPELQAELAATHCWLVRYNAALGASPAERRALLLERLAAVGDGAVIRPPFHCDYGLNISLGAGVFLNFNCAILDVVAVKAPHAAAALANSVSPRVRPNRSGISSA